MNRTFFRYLGSVILLSLICCLPIGASAQEKGGPLSDENARLMQEYMVRRAEWLELRRSALDKVKTAKDEKERKQHLEKLAEDEKPIRSKVNEAARAYRAAEKAKHDQLAASNKPAK